jgi:hypothetical protein
LLKVRVKRHARELRHLGLALPQYLLKFLGADLTSSSATEYSIAVIVRHKFLLSTSDLVMVTLKPDGFLDNDKTYASIQFQIGTRSADAVCDA